MISRRDAIGVIAATGIGAFAGPRAPANAAAERAACVLTPELEIGPFFVDLRLNRSDLRGASADHRVDGVPLALALAIESYDPHGCAPLSGARVDLWHADARGKYSAEASEYTDGQSFLRGYQTTDAGGRVAFTTIFPGWYAGRAVHIHVMIRTFSAPNVVARQYTTQLFFDPGVTRDVMRQPPYAVRGEPFMTNAADRIYAASGGRTTLALAKASGGYTGSIDIGVRPA